MPNWLKLFLAILLCEGAGILGSLFTVSSIPTWYATLNKPFFSPPNWVFGPIWTTLYLFMGISLYLIWQDKKVKKQVKEGAIKIFLAQLFFNFIWSIVFFGAHNILGALAIILVLWVLIFETIKRFSKINKNASLLLYPYLTWVTIATILNFSIWVLNQ